MQLGPFSEKLNHGFNQYSLLQEEDLLTNLDDCSHTLQSYVDSLDKQWSNRSENCRSEMMHLDSEHKENFYED